MYYRYLYNSSVLPGTGVQVPGRKKINYFNFIHKRVFGYPELLVPTKLRHGIRCHVTFVLIKNTHRLFNSGIGILKSMEISEEFIFEI